MIMVFGLLAIMMMALTDSAEAGEGRLGQSLVPPAEIPLTEHAHDYLLAGPAKISVDPAAMTATLSYETVQPVPYSKAYYGVYLPGQTIKKPQFIRFALENQTPGGSLAHRVVLDLKPLVEFTGARQDSDQGMVVAYRIEVPNPARETSILYDGRFRVDSKNQRVPCVVLGPFVNKVDKDSVTISWDSDLPATGYVAVEGILYGDDLPRPRREITITGLEPGRTYNYEIYCDGLKDIKTYQFTTAPASTVPFSFSCISDSQEGFGGGEANGGGVNIGDLSRFLVDSRNDGVSFILFGGDRINGYTTNETDYRMQLRAFKHTAERVGCYLPIYTAIGNHDLLLNWYESGQPLYGYENESIGTAVFFDQREAVEGRSSESVFAEEFVNPDDSYPAPESPSAPQYRENAYYFDYANARFIVLNSNYWYSVFPERYGGNFRGYIMDNQFRWLEELLERSNSDPTIDHVFVIAHDPMFHKDDTFLRWEKRQYLIERRDALWEALSRNGKVVAFLCGHEHHYSRLLIDNQTPVYLNKTTNTRFTYPVWQITTGGAGAPLNARDTVPWDSHIQSYYPGKHYCVIDVNGKSVTLTVKTETGEVVDRCILK